MNNTIDGTQQQDTAEDAEAFVREVTQAKLDLAIDTLEALGSPSYSDVAKAAIDIGIPVAALRACVVARGIEAWPEPQAVAVTGSVVGYPDDALPGILRDAAIEVQRFTGAPMPMVASAGIAALSLACQQYVDVQRAQTLVGPVGLYLLVVADPGERKSTCDRLFTAALRAHEERQYRASRVAMEEHEASTSIWTARMSGLKDRIRQAAKAGKPYHEVEQELRYLSEARPEQPRCPRLFYGDVTPEALAFCLAKRWPAGGIFASEGGIVLGGYGMGKESVMRNLALFNMLWESGTLQIDRKTSDPIVVRGARLTLFLQVQETTLREFLSHTNGLARGSGFLSRFLFLCPESTQGHRVHHDEPDGWPALTAFGNRITEILGNQVVISDGMLTPKPLRLSEEAVLKDTEFLAAIENSVREGGSAFGIRDVAGKLADNAARLAALFHVLENGMEGEIGRHTYRQATRVMAWHLEETKRFWDTASLPVEMSDAARLDAWLVRKCRRDAVCCVGKRDARQSGPVQDGPRFALAIADLTETDRIRVEKDGRRWVIRLNPEVLLNIFPVIKDTDFLSRKRTAFRPSEDV